MVHWEPDTHLDTHFDGRVDPTHPDGRMIVSSGTLAGVPFTSAIEAQAAYDKACGFNQTKNQLIEYVRLNAHPALLKPMLDEDGDPVIREDGKPEMVLKAKHQVIVTHDYRIGLLAVSIPNVEKTDLDPAKVHADLHASLADFHGNNRFAVAAIGIGAVDPSKTLIAPLEQAKQYHQAHLAKVGLQPFRMN